MSWVDSSIIQGLTTIHQFTTNLEINLTFLSTYIQSCNLSYTSGLSITVDGSYATDTVRRGIVCSGTSRREGSRLWLIVVRREEVIGIGVHLRSRGSLYYEERQSTIPHYRHRYKDTAGPQSTLKGNLSLRTKRTATHRWSICTASCTHTTSSDQTTIITSTTHHTHTFTTIVREIVTGSVGREQVLREREEITSANGSLCHRLARRSWVDSSEQGRRERARQRDTKN